MFYQATRKISTQFLLCCILKVSHTIFYYVNLLGFYHFRGVCRLLSFQMRSCFIRQVLRSKTGYPAKGHRRMVALLYLLQRVVLSISQEYIMSPPEEKEKQMKTISQRRISTDILTSPPYKCKLLNESSLQKRESHVVIHVCISTNLCTIGQVELDGQFAQFARGLPTIPVADSTLMIRMVLFAI